MGFTADIDNNAAKAAEEAAAGGNGSFPPLPAGKYQATIAKIKGVSDFAKTGPNAGKKVVEIGFQIVADSPNGKGRYIWDRVPLFSRFAPSDKYPDGAPAKAYFDFWEKAIGLPREVVLSGNLPDNIGGTQVTITLSAPIPPDDYNPLGSNEISFYDKAGDVSQTPVGIARAPWLDEHGNLLSSYSPAATQAAVQQHQQQTGQQAPPAWQPSAAEVNTAIAQTAAQAGPPAWGGAPTI